MAPGLSARGQAMAAGAVPAYLRAHMTRRDDPDYVGLAVAENHQVAPLVRRRLERPAPLPDRVLAYSDTAGTAEVRAAVAGLLGGRVLGRAVDPDQVCVLAGAGAVVEAMAFALADPGEVVLVPTPSYAGFWADLEVRAGLRIQPVHTRAEEGFRLTPELLDLAVAGAPGPVRALLLTNPDNPRGEVVSSEDVEAVLGWTEDRRLHLIADEVYALSVHGARRFTSAGALRPRLGERLHLVWAVSKDLGASGLRCGVAVTEHAGLRRALALQGTWAGVSGHTQHLLAEMLADTDWIAAYLPAMREGLRRSATVVRTVLDAAGIPRTAGDAGFFLLADLRAHLDAPTWQAEHRLWQRILDGAGVNLTPGSACRAVQPGWFRICHAAHPVEVVAAALRRMVAVLQDGRPVA